MRKIVAEMAVSLDGFFEGPEGELDWLMFSSETDYANKLLDRFDTIFFGCKAYQRFGIPRMIETNHEGERQFHHTLNNMRKYVFTGLLKHVPGNGMVIGSNIRWEVERIRDEDGKDIWLCGGVDIIRSFARLNLIDEYIIAVHPIILAEGRSFFSNISEGINLTLKGTETLASGVIMLNYQVN